MALNQIEVLGGGIEEGLDRRQASTDVCMESNKTMESKDEDKMFPAVDSVRKKLFKFCQKILSLQNINSI